MERDKTFEPKQSGQRQTDVTQIKGIVASRGRYTGKVCIVQGETEFYKIQSGEVLVCPITSPV